MTQRTVLIAEDDDIISESLRILLESKGFKVLAAADGEAAVEIAMREKPSALVLDIGIPKISGVEVCRKIKSSPETKDVKILISTGMGRQDAVQEALAAGADGYLLKPFGGAGLFKALEEVFAR